MSEEEFVYVKAGSAILKRPKSKACSLLILACCICGKPATNVNTNVVQNCYEEYYCDEHRRNGLQ